MSSSLSSSSFQVDSIECSICFLSPPLIPVWFTCFPCRKEANHPNCNSIARVCWKCARTYLESDKKKTVRSSRKRCLQCQAYTNPKLFTSQTPGYIIDYMLMKLDNTRRKCIYSSEGCRVEGFQMEILEHSQNSCEYRSVVCEGCHHSYKSLDMEVHKSQCIEYKLCPLYSLCSPQCRFILVKNMEAHLEERHQSKTCPKCSEIVLLESFEMHETEMCPRRLIHCTFCDGTYPLCEYASHYEADMVMLLERKKNYWLEIRKIYQDMEANHRKIVMIETMMGNIYSLHDASYSSSSSFPTSRHYLNFNIHNTQQENHPENMSHNMNDTNINNNNINNNNNNINNNNDNNINNNNNNNINNNNDNNNILLNAPVVNRRNHHRQMEDLMTPLNIHNSLLSVDNEVETQDEVDDSDSSDSSVLYTSSSSSGEEI